MDFTPSLTKETVDGIDILRDAGAGRRGVLVAFLGRSGGVSRKPFDTLNLGLRTADDPGKVIENRARAAAALSFDPQDLVLAKQIHGARVLEAAPGAAGSLGEGDGLVVRNPGPVLGILTADCAPVVLAGRDSIALLHAGWRGIVAGVVERGLERVRDVWGAWVGPSIHACCYEVGGEVIEAFRERDLPVASERSVDPARAVEAILNRNGVDRVEVSGICTMHDPGYFSFRRDGETGRQGAFAALLG